MASWRFSRLLRRLQTSGAFSFIQRQNAPTSRYISFVVAAVSGAGAFYVYNVWKADRHLPVLPVAHNEVQGEEDGVSTKKMTYREARFRQFASVEYRGTIYMTPQDFLESITEESPRPRIGRAKLSRQELENWLRHTPKLSRGSDHLFRSLHNKGIISYTEYLFLLCVLTMQVDPPQERMGSKANEPHSGFRIAFNMFDTDGNQIVDKREFLVLERVFSKQGQAKGSQPASPSQEHDEEIPDTTLLIHFFGSKGTQVLNYNDFHKFMANLQSEVIELEFMEFSRGLSTISEVDFAKILLRYTSLDRGQIEECLERVRSRIPQEKGISLEDFRQFCQFLNSLDDFALTMKMYTYSQKSVSQEDFQRAVKVCTGHTLGPHIVNTVFQIFDSDYDGHLSHQEFISIMRDRLHRGARSHLMHTKNSWDSFRACVRNEMRSF
ncbi:calcium uptake protein 3, mitochondrial-like isoform X2 [Babylonia areolata]|uniref:calcium uptake protein 3, mitochondrial-like isoform X2 n=1 Tax=Babylonia areolata TaxID=304850 RepID=UPI003FD2390A